MDGLDLNLYMNLKKNTIPGVDVTRFNTSVRARAAGLGAIPWIGRLHGLDGDDDAHKHL